ncbi:MAG: ATP-binding protein [Bacteroidota bacterium]
MALPFSKGSRLRRNHRLQVVLRVVGIGATVAGALWLWRADLYLAAALAAGGVLWGLASLVRYTEKTPRDLTRFLEAIRYDDFSQGFSSAGRGGLFEDLSAAFNEVTDAFRRIRSEREEQARTLQTVIQHVGVALIAFRPDTGEVVLVNNAAKRLLGLGRFRSLQKLDATEPTLARTLRRLQSGSRTLVTLEREDQPLQLFVNATRFRLVGTVHTLVTLQDIRQELEAKEMDAWQQLTRVLTHEIANSVAPIASLASTASGLLIEAPPSGDGGGPPRVHALDADDATDVHEALRTIERRSKGLMHFVDAYRSLAKVPKPKLELVAVRELAAPMRYLLRASLDAHGIAFDIDIEPDMLEVAADPELIEQVLINLLLNAIQALEGQPDGRIVLRAFAGPTGRPVIEIVDNGPGIQPEARDKIFVPFFTTKQSGSGIGLALSRQILRRHGGTLTVRSTPDVETVFALRF